MNLTGIVVHEHANPRLPKDSSPYLWPILVALAPVAIHLESTKSYLVSNLAPKDASKTPVGSTTTVTTGRTTKSHEMPWVFGPRPWPELTWRQARLLYWHHQATYFSIALETNRQETNLCQKLSTTAVFNRWLGSTMAVGLRPVGQKSKGRCAVEQHMRAAPETTVISWQPSLWQAVWLCCSSDGRSQTHIFFHVTM